MFVGVIKPLFPAQEGIPVYRANEKPPSTSVPRYAMLLDKNINLSSTPMKLHKHMQISIWDKQFLVGEVGEKMFNPTLMNKLIRIE